MKKIFIDGKTGTTGLRIYERLGMRDDISIITLPDEKRKDIHYRKQALNECDIAFLCLPDDAAREAVSLIENKNTVVIDTSTAHRTNPDWAYGFPELSTELENRIKNSGRIAVPGCHASGFISLVYPLIEKKVLDKSTLLSCFSITGYSGGGKRMIAEYEDGKRDLLFGYPRQYALTQQHKHLPEMKAITGIDNEPVFCPVIGDFYSGMQVSVPLFAKQLICSVEEIAEIYKEKYDAEIVKYDSTIDSTSPLSAGILSGTDAMRISVFGSGERIVLCSAYDNLGKGASGAAIECLNIVLGTDKTKGLKLTSES